eukprot:1161084-Rhodomonas_salina.2
MYENLGPVLRHGALCARRRREGRRGLLLTFAALSHAVQDNSNIGAERMKALEIAMTKAYTPNRVFLQLWLEEMDGDDYEDEDKGEEGSAEDGVGGKGQDKQVQKGKFGRSSRWAGKRGGDSGLMVESRGRSEDANV